MTDLKFIKTFGLVLIGIGFVVALVTALYITHNPQTMLNANNSYFAGLLGGLGIGLSLSGALLRLYSASNS